VPPPPCSRIERIEVIKSARLVRAHCENGALVEMDAALGREPIGQKLGSGDARTPEGEYRISGRPRRSRFHLFIPIDYPSAADAEAALADGRLSASGYRRIVSAHESGEPPPGDTALGGQLGFHGEGARWRGDSRYLDWTYGCVALSDRDIDFLAEHSAVGTRVEIVP
jgi:murein L,D-transpeptidase YafK